MRKIIISLIILNLICTLAAERFSPIGLNNACSCRRPHAVGVYNHKANKTFICWAYKNMDIAVIEYDHSIGRWSEKKILPGLGKNDFHNYPVMIQDREGYLHIFASSMGKKLHLHYISKSVSSIKGWQTKNIEPLIKGKIGVSYIMPMIDNKTGELFLFCRALFPGEDYCASQRKYIMMRSEDNGLSWKTPQTILHFTDTTHLNNSPYPANITFAPRNNEYPDRFLFAWSTCNGHPKGSVKFNNVYFAYMALDNSYKHKKYNLYSADKRTVGTIIREKNRKQVMVFDTNNLLYRSVHHYLNTSYLDNGNPCIIFRFKKKFNADKMEVNLWSSIWQNNKWQNKKINNKQFIFINNFLKLKNGHEIIALDLKKENQFYISTDNCKSWTLRKSFSLYKAMVKFATITNYSKEIKYFSTVGGKSYSLTHSQPCYIYGNIAPQLLCHYSFDNERNKIVGDTGLFQVNGVMKHKERGNGKTGKAFMSSPQKPNKVIFPHCTEIINDFTVSFWLKVDASDLEKKTTIIGTSPKVSASKLKAGWKIGSFIANKDIIQFIIYDKQGRRQKVGIPGFFKSYSDKWTKLNFIFKSGKYLKIFVNNECKAIKKIHTQNIAYAEKCFLTIGSDSFYGLIDDVRICDGVVLETEKLKAYNYIKQKSEDNPYSKVYQAEEGNCKTVGHGRIKIVKTGRARKNAFVLFKNAVLNDKVCFTFKNITNGKYNIAFRYNAAPYRGICSIECNGRKASIDQYAQESKSKVFVIKNIEITDKCLKIIFFVTGKNQRSSSRHLAFDEFMLEAKAN